MKKKQKQRSSLHSICLKAGHRFTKTEGILPTLLPGRNKVTHWQQVGPYLPGDGPRGISWASLTSSPLSDSYLPSSKLPSLETDGPFLCLVTALKIYCPLLQMPHKLEFKVTSLKTTDSLGTSQVHVKCTFVCFSLLNLPFVTGSIPTKHLWDLFFPYSLKRYFTKEHI